MPAPTPDSICCGTTASGDKAAGQSRPARWRGFAQVVGGLVAVARIRGGKDRCAQSFSRSSRPTNATYRRTKAFLVPIVTIPAAQVARNSDIAPFADWASSPVLPSCGADSIAVVKRINATPSRVAVPTVANAATAIVLWTYPASLAATCREDVSGRGWATSSVAVTAAVAIGRGANGPLKRTSVAAIFLHGEAATSEQRR